MDWKQLVGYAHLFFLVSMASFVATAAPLPQPRVEVKYSLEGYDGGAYTQFVSGTLLGLGDGNCTMYIPDPNSSGPTCTVQEDAPLFVTINYTAAPGTSDIIEGPVVLVESTFDRKFTISASGTVTVTDISSVVAIAAEGVLAGGTITWDNVVPWHDSTTGISTCTGLFCPFSERIEDGTPTPHDLPTFSVLTASVLGDGVATDAQILMSDDDDATTHATWDGVEVNRVPEPGGLVLLVCGVAGLSVLGRGHRG